MALNDFQIGLIAGLDETKSKQQLSQDIEALKNQLGEIKIQAKLDDKTIADLTRQLNSAQINLQNVSISQTAITKMVSQINSALSGININIGNLNNGGIVQNAQRTGQQIGQQIQSGISSVIQKGNFDKIFKDSGSGINNVSKEAEAYFQKLSNIVSVQEKLGENNNLTGFVVSLKNADGIVEQLNYRLQTLKDDKGNILDRFFQYSGGSINNNGVIKQFDTIATKADNLFIKLEKLKNNYSDLNASRPIKDASNISALETQYNKVSQAIEGLRNADNSTMSSMEANVKKEIAALESMISQFRNAENVASTMKSVDISSALNIAKNNLAKFKTEASNFSQMENMVKSLDTAISQIGDKASLDKFTDQLRVAKSELQAVKKEASQYVTEQRRLSMANTIEAWNQKNSKATKEVKVANEQYIVSLRDLNTQMTKMEFGNIQMGFKNTETAMRGLGRLGASFKDQMKQAAESFTQWVSVSSGIMTLVYQFKQSVSELKDIDDIITEISKTSDMTTPQLKELASSSFDKASNLGRTASDYLSGVEEMARSGYYGDQGESMAQQSLLAQAAGDMTAELANKYILATNAAYKLNGSAEKLNEILDGQNMVSNRNSVAMEDMAEGMSKAGTVASSYRVSVEDLTAMIGTMEAVTKSGGEEVGNALKSILINLQNVSSSKITGTLDKANASMTELVDGTEKLRNPIAILRDLAKTFNSLDEDDPLRAEILTNVGGKYQASKLAALLQNVDMMDKMLKDYSEGSGSAMEEAQKSVDSLSGRLNTLSNTWSSTVNNIVGSDELKTAVSFLNEILTGVNKLTSALGIIGTLGLGGGIVAGIKNVGRDKMYSLSF